MASKSEKPTTDEFGKLRAYLAQRGASQQWIAEHTDITKTRQEIADDLKAAMRELR